MAKLENPYSKILDEISEASQLHRIEGNRIKRDVLETKLEENVRRYANDPMAAEIRAQKHISEDDQGYLDMNMFSTTFYKGKLDLSKDFEKEVKKFEELASQYKSLIQQRITKFELNASILSKFTPEELQKNPKLSKMMNDVPEGYDVTRKKYIKQDAVVSGIYAKFIMKNPEEYAEKLFDFLAESKEFRKQFMAMKQAEIDSLKVKAPEAQKEAPKYKAPVDGKLFGKSQADFDFLRGVIKEEDKCSSDQLNELKQLISKVFDSELIARLNKLEEELSNEYQKLDTVDGIIAKRLQVSLDQFNRGVSKINDMVVETGTLPNLIKAVENLLDKEVYKADLTEIRHNPAMLNMLVGYSTGIKHYLKTNYISSKKRVFGILVSKADPGLDRLNMVHQDYIRFLADKLSMDPVLVNKDVLETMITDDKKDELAYALMNNVTAITNTGDITDWHDAMNRLLAHCILAMVSAIEENKDPMLVIDEYQEQYGSKETKVETSQDEEVTRRRGTRSYANKEEQTNTIKNILR